MSTRPRLVTPEDVEPAEYWTCWYDGTWGFLGDGFGYVCEGCGNVMCDQCASAHDCAWA